MTPTRDRHRRTTELELREAAARLAAAREDRDRLVVRMRREGATLRTIAEAAGLTHAGVAGVLEARGAK